MKRPQSTRSKNVKQQSAMEYLMTYGWALLIIAIVLVALYALGIFNAYTFAPRAAPGGCEISRNVETTALEGECNGAIPEFVSNYNGGSSYVNLQEMTQEDGTQSVSYSVWFKTLSLTSSWPMLFGDTEGANGLNREGYDLFVCGPGCVAGLGELVLERFCGGQGNCGTVQSPSPLSQNTWYNAVVTYNGGTQSLSLYLNGVLQASTLSNPSINVNTPMNIGAASFGWNPGAYQIANFQAYNTSLDAGAVMSLYVEGIGGVPVEPQYTFGWWPLNGNLNDYSGNSNTGSPIAISYVGSWTNGYTNP